MDKTELQAIIEAVTGQVMAAMAQKEADSAKSEGLKKILSVGEREDIPAFVSQGAVICGLEDYKPHRNILCYDCVVITRLGITDLADIALGRAGSEACCAVVNALLNGVEVLMTEDAPEHRKFSGRGSVPLYQLLEGYVNTLRVFGVKPVSRKEKPAPPPPAKPAKFAPAPAAAPRCGARPNFERLITESDALEMVKQGGEITVPASAIITPAAYDVFSAARVTLLRRSQTPMEV